MTPLPQQSDDLLAAGEDRLTGPRTGGDAARWEVLVGPVSETRRPHVVFADEPLDQALRQLVLSGRSGQPVLSPDGRHVRGWISRNNVLRILAERVRSSEKEAEQGKLAAELSDIDAESRVHESRTPLGGYEIVELVVRPGSAGVGKRLGDIPWPVGTCVVAVTARHELVVPSGEMELHPGERVVLLAPVGGAPRHVENGTELQRSARASGTDDE